VETTSRIFDALSQLHTLKTWHCPHMLLRAVLRRGCCCCVDRASIDRYLLPAGPTAANPPHAAAAGEWDKRTDSVPFYRPCSAHYAGSANIIDDSFLHTQ